MFVHWSAVRYIFAVVIPISLWRCEWVGQFCDGEWMSCSCLVLCEEKKNGMSNSGFSLTCSFGLRSESKERVLFKFSLSTSGTTESYQLLFIKQGIVHKLHQYPLHLEQILNRVKSIHYSVTESSWKHGVTYFCTTWNIHDRTIIKRIVWHFGEKILIAFLLRVRWERLIPPSYQQLVSIA